MREYLFHGKRKDNGEWVDGGSIFKLINKSGEHFFIPQLGEKLIATHNDNMNIIALEGCILYKVDPETVGQYTGLRDCKRTAEYPEGQMIFEGDILKTIFGVGYVVYGIGCFSVQYEPTNRPAIDIVMNDSDVFVIGNIHDNKELLKEGGE